MMILEQIIQSQLQHMQKGIEILNNRETFYNEIAYYSLLGVGLIAIGMWFFMYRKNKQLKPESEKQ